LTRVTNQNGAIPFEWSRNQGCGAGAVARSPGAGAVFKI